MSCRNRFGTILLLLATTTIQNTYAGGQAYTFTINGETVHPVHYSLNADESTFAPGDVVYVGEKQFPYGGLFMTLGEERMCRFVTSPAKTQETGTNDPDGLAPVKDGRVFLELQDGRRQVVAVIVTTCVRRDPAGVDASKGTGRASFQKIPVNPLDTMSPEEIHGLWGIYLNHWPEGIEQKLAHVDPDRICVTITDYAGAGAKQASFLGGPLFPPIPPTIRYLIAEERMSPGLRDFSPLSRFHNLTFLIFESMGPQETLPIGLISENPSLRYLDLSHAEIRGYPSLASLTELRFLDISGQRDIDNIKFVKGMGHLRTLIMDGTRVSSLSPLDGSDSIQKIHASTTWVRGLPKGDLPSLKTVNLISTKVDPLAIAQFRADHPTCKVEYDWADSLREAVQGTTRLRVRSGGTCHRRIEREKTLAEITNPQEIERFLAAINIDESHSGGECMCCGDPTFEFYSGDRLLAMIGYHHGERLRWADGEWPGDAELTAASRGFFISWLSQHGVAGPQREVDETQK